MPDRERADRNAQRGAAHIVPATAKGRDALRGRVACNGGPIAEVVREDEGGRAQRFAQAHRVLRTFGQLLKAHERAIDVHGEAVHTHQTAMDAHESLMRAHEQLASGVHDLLVQAGVLLPTEPAAPREGEGGPKAEPAADQES